MNAVTQIISYAMLVALMLVMGAIILAAVVSIVELWFRCVWRRATVKQMKRNVKLGWNTGTPPPGSKFLVLEYASDLRYTSRTLLDENSWAVMERQGDYAVSPRGSRISIFHILGWLQVQDAKPAEPVLSVQDRNAMMDGKQPHKWQGV